MVVAEPRRPAREPFGERGADGLTRLHLHVVALAVVETHRLHPCVAVERPGEAGGAVLPTGEEEERGFVEDGGAHAVSGFGVC